MALLLEGKYFGVKSSFARLSMGDRGKIIQVKEKMHKNFDAC